MLSDKERIATLEAQVARLNAQLVRFEARFPEPKPIAPAEPPAWAGPQKGEFGINYAGNGKPSETAPTGTGGFGGYRKETRPNGDWKGPDGKWRNAEGLLVTASTALQPPGPDAPPRTFADDVIDRLTPLHTKGD